MPSRNYDPVKKKAAAKRFRDKNKDKAREYYQTVVKPKAQLRKAERNAKCVELRKANPEKRRAYERAWYEKNREKILERKNAYSKIPENRNKTRIAVNIRYKEDMQFRLIKILRNRLKRFFNGTRKEKKTIELLGCSREFLMYHLESQFTEGMSWDNYGFGGDKWSIDHIKPLSLFNLADTKELEVAAHYTNLQPMWCSENFSKGNRYVG